jgi:deoxyribonuclease V
MPPLRACWPNAPRSSPRQSPTGRDSSTCANSRRCAVLDDLSGLGLLVVDGYADLDPSGRPGLGAHAHAEFGIPVIGVAKSRFRTATHAVPVVRGSSVRPLFVTAAGMPRAEAADLVRRMTGRYRLPDALRRADTLARAGPPAAP